MHKGHILIAFTCPAAQIKFVPLVAVVVVVVALVFAAARVVIVYVVFLAFFLLLLLLSLFMHYIESIVFGLSAVY